MRGSENRYPQGITRRDFLRLASLAGGVVFTGCSPKLEPTPTPTRISKPSTPTPTPRPTRTPEPIFPPTPEAPRLLEKIEVPIPDLAVERYKTSFADWTNLVPAAKKQKLIDAIAQGEDYKSEVMIIAGKSAFGSGIEVLAADNPFKHCGSCYFYYYGDRQRFYGQIETNDNLILPDMDYTVFSQYQNIKGISENGKILIARFAPKTLELKLGSAHVLVDVLGGTKTVIRDTRKARPVPDERISEILKPKTTYRQPVPDFEAQLTGDGKKLLLSFPVDEDRKSYLIDLNNWTCRPITIDNKVGQMNLFWGLSWGNEYFSPNMNLVLNYDGTRLYLPFAYIANKRPHPNTQFPYYGEVWNLDTGEVQAINWPFGQACPEGNPSWHDPTAIASENFTCIAQNVRGVNLQADISANTHLSSEIYTPWGFFHITSNRIDNILVHRIHDNGDFEALIRPNIPFPPIAKFRFENGSYKPLPDSRGILPEVRITKQAS